LTQYATILVVDDDPAIRALMSFHIENKGYAVDVLETGEEVIERLDHDFNYDLVLLDMMLPGIDGMQVLKAIRREYAACQVIIITGHASVKLGVEAIKSGAFDFICKPFNIDQLLQIVHNSLETAELRKENARLRNTIWQPVGISELIGQSMCMKEVKRLIRLAAESRANVLITGESGTGKEIVAKAIHLNSHFSRGPFVVVNCGAIPSTLIEAELFGYEKGAFTNALQLTKGKFEQAQYGTIFLDEISELPFEAQVKLLRIIQEKEVVRIGGNELIKLHLRIIAATNVRLRERMKQGMFREDLYYRIALFLIDLPGLNERGEDILLLAKHFLQKYSEFEERPVAVLTDSAEKSLTTRCWSGHVRELENCLYRTLLHNPEKSCLSAGDLHFLPGSTHSIEQIFAEGIRPFSEVEQSVITDAMRLTGGNISKAAEKLKMARGTLYRKVKAYGILDQTPDSQPSEETRSD